MSFQEFDLSEIEAAKEAYACLLYTSAWYAVAFVLITIVCSFLMGIYVPFCSQIFPPAVYNILITIINGGVQMVIYFPIYKIIFPEEKKTACCRQFLGRKGVKWRGRI